MTKRYLISLQPAMQWPLLFLLLLLLILPIFPHELPNYVQRSSIMFHALSIEDGLTQNSVNVIFQDKTGFIWFGTMDGLNRFDGYQFKYYKFSPDNPNTLSDNSIQALCEDYTGKIWVGTQNGGLDMIDTIREKVTHYEHKEKEQGSISNDSVTTIYEDSKKILWVGTEKGLNRYDHRSGGFLSYLHIPGKTGCLSHDDIRSICEDENDNLWIGTWGGGLNYFNRKSGTFEQFLTKIPEAGDFKNILNVQEDGAGFIFVSAPNGIIRFKIEPGSKKPVQSEIFRFDQNIYGEIHAVFLDAKETVWIGTGKGLHRLDCSTGEILSFRSIPGTPRSLRDNLVLSFYRDIAGDLWIGTAADGVFRLSKFGNRFECYRKDTDVGSPLIDSTVNALYQDDEGVLWIGTLSGIKRFDRKKNQVTHYRNSPGKKNTLSSDTVRSIYEDHRGSLWIGTWGGGLNCFQKEQGKFKHYENEPGNPESLSNNDVNCIYEDQAGTLWIGTRGGGLNRLVRDEKGDGVSHFIHYHNQPGTNGLSGKNINCILEDRFNFLWIGTEYHGLNRFSPGSGEFTQYSYQRLDTGSISHNYILSLLEDSRGTLWVGTNGGGLNSFDFNKNYFTRFTEKNGLPSNVIFGILEDGDGNLWLSTNRGLCRFNPQTQEFKNYDHFDGLQSDEFNSGAYFKSPSGEMFFGGPNGFNAFFPERIKDNPYLPPVVITGFQLYNKRIEVGEEIEGLVMMEKELGSSGKIRISHRDSIFTFQFAALNYISPHKNRYSYIMENLESEWNEVQGRNFAPYTKVPPGHYVFRVRGSNNDGLWNNVGASVEVIVIPPFWETPVFQVFLVCVIIMLILFVYRLRIRTIRKSQKELEHKVEQRTWELKRASQYKSDFLARMSHEIRTPMNSVIGFADMLMETQLDEEQSTYAKSIQNSGESLLTLINDILDLSRVEAGQLSFFPIEFDPEVAAFDVCEMISPRTGDKPVDILCRIGDQVPAYVKTDAGRFRQVLLNLMGNAVKFTEEGEVELTLDVEKEEQGRIKLHVTVRDTGIGIPPEKIDSIFEVFQQADVSVGRKYGGTGLGLPICKQIARMMGGEIQAESWPGVGTVFHFTAWVEKATKKVQSPMAQIPSYLPGKKVLVVDDNLVNLDISSHILKKAGLRVTGVMDGGEALDELSRSKRKGERFDLCILDIHLPGKSGYDILREIRKDDSGYGNLPVLAFTSSLMTRTKEIKAAGFDGFLPKPVQRKKLISMIARLLGNKGNQVGELERSTLITQHTLVEEAKHSLRILLAEDNPTNQKLARFMLTKAGYHLDIVNNGKEAIDTYCKSPDSYDIILMDVQMPEMDGIEATQIIRARGFTAVPIIAVTANVMPNEVGKLLKAGMDDFIPKPIKREEVFEKVKKWAIDR